MKIKEVSQSTGLSKKTIRFYEESELVAPEKRRINGRDFRDYSEANVAWLQQVTVLRMAQFTLEEIRTMLEGNRPVQEIYDAYYI